jgi:hypothetical protein
MRAAMGYDVGLDVGHKRTSDCVLDGDDSLALCGETDTQGQ